MPSGPPQGLPRTRRIQKRPDFVRIQDSPVRVSTRHLLILLARATTPAGSGGTGGLPPSSPAGPGGMGGLPPSSPAGPGGMGGLPPASPTPLSVPAADARPSRLGVVASRKVGPAVTRNRAKRLVREVFRRSGDTFPAGLDVVIIVRPTPRWGPRRPTPPGPPLLGLAELGAEIAGVAPVLARRARELAGRR